MSLALYLRRLIALEGPIPVARFMTEALLHPELGYYTRKDPLGRSGDFITAPEISQMFGELVGLWCAEVWQGMGAPERVMLIELGPGRGTLMADALRAMAVLPPLRDALRLHLVEASPALRAAQDRTLAGVFPAAAPAWHQDFSSVPDGPSIVIANEFFDALPIRQFVRQADGWHERMIGPGTDADSLGFVLAPQPAMLAGLLTAAVIDAPIGAVAEICPAGRAIAGGIAARLCAFGGAALIVDYGPAQSAAGDSLQAVRQHAYHPPLERPGEADITAHVDFAALAAAARAQGAGTLGPVPQGAFLRALGIETRAARLKAGAEPHQRRDIDAALQRLTGADTMGTLFKALAITHPDLPAPPGFDT